MGTVKTNPVGVKQKNGHNPLFTRSEKRRGRVARAAARRHRSVKHQVKGWARSKFGALFGIPLNRDLLTGKGRHRSSARSGQRRSGGPSVRSDIVSALRGQGYSATAAKQMAERVQPGDSFSDAFRRVMARNPGELVIFGNPAHVFTRMGVIRAKRAGNPIPAAILQGLEWTAGSQLLGGLERTAKKPAIPLTSGKRTQPRAAVPHKHRGPKRRNPHALDRAKDLFQRFQHRPGDVYESQRSARIRKDYAILGPLVAIGTNAEKYDQFKRDYIAAKGKAAWEEFSVDHWDKLPHQAFLTGAQVAMVKRILGEPDKYVGDCPQLASSPNGKQLYALIPDGVDPDFLREYDVDQSKDYIDLGEATFVVYIAKKPYDPVEHVHTLGEAGGTRPRLGYARLPKELFFSGGSYSIEGPGILN